MHDLVIRNGTLVDGSGAPARVGDLAIDGGLISSVDGKAGPGRCFAPAAGLRRRSLDGGVGRRAGVRGGVDVAHGMGLLG